MDWKILLAGVVAIVIGYFLPQFSDWVYGNGRDDDTLIALKKRQAGIGRIICITLGLIAILQFFGGPKIFR